MDNYPGHLDPPRDEFGAVNKEAFAEWWALAAKEFPTVPENVARYWLHEHWGVSPYRYLKSRSYKFTRLAWPSPRLLDFRSTWDNYDPECQGCIKKGRQLVTDTSHGPLYWTAAYMLENRDFPVPIIVLDNRDDHHSLDYPDQYPIPSKLILIEGHTRFNIGTFLQTVGGLNETVDIWLMSRIG